MLTTTGFADSCLLWCRAGGSEDRGPACCGWFFAPNSFYYAVSKNRIHDGFANGGETYRGLKTSSSRTLRILSTVRLVYMYSLASFLDRELVHCGGRPILAEPEGESFAGGYGEVMLSGCKSGGSISTPTPLDVMLAGRCASAAIWDRSIYGRRRGPAAHPS